MTVSALWTVACVVTPTFLILCHPHAVAALPPGLVGGNVTSGCEGDVKDLHIMGFYPFSGPWHGGESLLASTTLAIEQINSMCVVPGYRLILLPADTKCDAGLVVYEFFQQLYTTPTKLLILGAACSFVSETIARASHLWNLVQLSYASVSPALSNKDMFPRFARVSTPDTVTNPARISLFRHFGWTHISTVHQNYDIFATTNDDLVRRLREGGFTVVRSEVFSDDPTLQVRNLADSDCRIIAGFFYEDKARQVFCEAYRRGLYGRRVVWVLGGWYEADWWRAEDDNIDCTLQEMEEAVHGYFDAGIIYYNPNPEPAVSGWLPSDFKAAYTERVQNRTLYGDIMTSQGYDAAWALALALNATRNTLLADGRDKALEDFTYEDKELSDLLYSSLLNVTFMGVRGPISFDANGDPLGLVKIDRVQGGEKRTVGYYNPMASDENSLDWIADNPVIWEGGTPPRDTTVTREEYLSLSVPLYASMCLLAALGIALALVFLAFNIVLRNVKVVKMSSPRLNNVILLGCMCSYFSVFVQDAGAGHGILGCEVKTALLVFGISLAFGALFAKTWRVHTIFANSKLQKKVVTDGQLMGMVAVLVVINTIVLVTWWLNDPRTVKITSTSTSLEEDKAGEVLVKRHEQSCVSDHQIYYLGTLYVIHALLLLCGTLLAYETRKVHYPELNDSKLIGMCIYNVALLCIPAVVLGVALNPELNLKYAISSSLVILGTTVTQCIIFLPKVKSYRQAQSSVDATPGTKIQHGTSEPVSSPATKHATTASGF